MRFLKIVLMTIALGAGHGHAVFNLGLETGVKAALGKDLYRARGPADGNGKTTTAKLPLILELGYRFTDNWYVGVYGKYAFNFFSDEYKTLAFGRMDNKPRISNMGLGINVRYRFSPDAMIDPWIGFGFGWEAERLSFETGGKRVGFTNHGVEFANLQAGLDIKLLGALAIAPYIGFSGGGFFHEQGETYSRSYKFDLFINTQLGLALTLVL